MAGAVIDGLMESKFGRRTPPRSATGGTNISAPPRTRRGCSPRRSIAISRARTTPASRAPSRSPTGRSDPHVAGPFVLAERRGDAVWLTLNRLSGSTQSISRCATSCGCSSRCCAMIPPRASPCSAAPASAPSPPAPTSQSSAAPLLHRGPRRARAPRPLGRHGRAGDPLIAAIHGYAYGAGLEMSLYCDLRVASADARFAIPEVTLGYIPSAGGTQTAPRHLNRGEALRMATTGDPITAERAYQLGFVQRIVRAPTWRLLPRSGPTCSPARDPRRACDQARGRARPRRLARRRPRARAAACRCDRGWRVSASRARRGWPIGLVALVVLVVLAIGGVIYGATPPRLRRLPLRCRPDRGLRGRRGSLPAPKSTSTWWSSATTAQPSSCARSTA